ncbi:X-ray repair cross-complementing protein 6 [Planococcus citri]|uniref:X-ray repair cross-complementing protein 6 n=1 Tax=Planococcus citri TaxID=170843 RepID=UPI0031F72C3F
MDDDGGFVFDAEDPAEKPEDLWNTRELTIYAIDCTESMFKSKYDDDSFFRLCLKCLKSIYMNKVIGQSNDLIGIVLFGTETSEPDLSFQHIRTFSEPKVSDADVVKKLENMIRSPNYCDFSIVFGHNDDYVLSDVLWHSSLLINKCTAKVKTKQIVLMTCNDDPHKNSSSKQHQARKKAEDLDGLGIQLDILPFGDSFNGDVFYKEILKIVNGEDITLPDGRQKVEELLARTYRKDYKKRSLSKTQLCLGNDIRIGIEVYNFYRRLYIPSIMKLDRRSNEPLKSVVQTYNTETGERLLKSDLNKCVEVGSKSISFNTEELNKLQMSGKRGLTLLGFKSLAYLQPEHHLKEPSFIYPNDELVKGSTNVFAALLKKCLEKQKFALCYYVTREQGRSNLIALVPQPEKCEGNVQIMPAGFHLIYLPYADNIREIQSLPTKTSLEPEQIDICKKIVKKLSFKYDPQRIENPKVQHHWANIEALALDQEKREVNDDTLCDFEFVSERLASLESCFLDAFYPDGYDPELELTKKRKNPASEGSRRAAKVPRVQIDPSDPLYVEKMVKSGQGDKLKVNELKTYLLENNVNVKGYKKGDMLNCVNDLLGIDA